MGEITDEQFENFEERGQYEDEMIEEQRFEKLVDDNYGELENIIGDRNPIIKAINNDKYVSINIKKDKDSSIIIEGILHIMPQSEINFNTLKHRFHNGEIKAINQHGKILRYEIIERIKIDK